MRSINIHGCMDVNPIAGVPMTFNCQITLTPAISVLNFLINDLFSTDVPAPLPALRACEPGPGVLTLVDNASVGYHIINGTVVSPTAGDAGYYYAPGLARKIGRAMFLSYEETLWTAGGDWQFGWSANPTIPVWDSPGAVLLISAGVGCYTRTSHSWVYAITDKSQITAPPDLGWVDVGIVLRSSGFWILSRSRNPGAGTNWRLLFVYHYFNQDPLYPGFHQTTKQSQIENFKVLDLEAPWDTDYGPALSYTPVSVPGQTGLLDTTGNGSVEVTFVAAPGEIYELDLHRTDVDNRWIIRLDVNNNKQQIIERNGGIETIRGDDACTLTPGNAYRVFARALSSNTSIACYVFDAVGNWHSIISEYTSVVFNAGVRNVQFSHAGINMAVWPSEVTLPAGL